jgi:thioester reductase-like protein
MPSGSPRHLIFLTGGTGLLGGVILGRLLALGHQVAVLVRGNQRTTASDRLEAVLRILESRSGRRLTRPVLVEGDLGVPGLGIRPDVVEWLRRNCRSVIHSAANLSFRPASLHPENEPYRTNVGGTQNLLNLFSAGVDVRWHYISTAYMSGLRAGRIRETEVDLGQKFANDYEHSKLLAELALRTELNPDQLTVYRPSIVIDLCPGSALGSDQTINRAYSLYRTLSVKAGLPENQSWYGLLGLTGDERKNIVTAEWVAAVMTGIFQCPALHSRIYHLTARVPVSVKDIESGFCKAVEQEQAHRSFRSTSVAFPVNEIAAPFLTAFGPYFRDDPDFDRRNLEDALAAIECHDQDSLNSSDIRDYCLQPASGIERRDVSEQPAAKPAPWEKYLRLALSFRSATEVSDRISAFPSGELHLTGPGGGLWQICLRESDAVLSPACESFSCLRWMMSAETLNDLISEQLSIDSAVRNGAAIYELDHLQDSSGIETGTLSNESLAPDAFLAELLIRIRSAISDDTSRQRSEVTHVRCS